MRTEFSRTHLRCPTCRGERTLVLTGTEAEREVREGELRCSVCGSGFTVCRGVGELMVNALEHVEREAAGLGRFAESMRNEGWTPQKIRRLPHIDDGYWFVQASSINQLLRTVPLLPGQWLLDIGSNTCWASNFFAVRGLEVVALDISLWEMQGLYTAECFIQDGTSYFERVLGSMNDILIRYRCLPALRWRLAHRAGWPFVSTTVVAWLNGNRGKSTIALNGRRSRGIR